MLLTGFDSKYLNTLYVDKNLKHHGLIQAFSRTNRVLNDTKPYGNILDFRGQEKAVDARDEAGFMQGDRHFHIGFTRLTQNDYLINMMEDIRDIMHLMGFKALGIPGRMQTVVLEHRKILSAVQSKNVQKCACCKFYDDTVLIPVSFCHCFGAAQDRRCRAG